MPIVEHRDNGMAVTQSRMTCYPGGFGPAHGHSSHRWALTANGEAGVPRDFVQTADSPFPVLPLPAGEGWVFYADKLQNRGSLGLFLLPEERAAGEVRLSSYAVSTVLTYPASARTLHLGFFAFETANAAAQQAFVASVACLSSSKAACPLSQVRQRRTHHHPRHAAGNGRKSDAALRLQTV